MCTSKPKQVLLLAICLMIMAGVQATPVEFSHTSSDIIVDYILDNTLTDPANTIGFQATLNYTAWTNAQATSLFCVQSDSSYAFTDGDAGFQIQFICAVSNDCTRDDLVAGYIENLMAAGTMANSGSDRVWTTGAHQT